jgi:signal transduction histidine kinase
MDQSALELQELQRIVAGGARALDLEVSLERCLELALMLAGTKAGLVYLADEHRDVYQLAHRCNVSDEMAIQHVPMGSFDENLTADHVLLKLDRYAHSGARAAIAAGLTHALYFMLRVEGKRIGFVALLFPSPPALADSTMRTLEAIFAFESVAILTARVHQQIERRAAVGNVLVDCAERLLDPKADATALILQAACKIARADRAFMSEVHTTSGVEYARIVAGVGKDVALIGRELPIATTPVLRESFAGIKATVIEDSSMIDPDSVIGTVARHHGTASFVLITLRHEGRHIGQLFAGAPERRHYTEAEINGMQLLASMSAQALERARQQKEERAQHERITALLEHLPLVVCVASRTGEILHSNAAGRAFAERLEAPPGTDWRTMMARMPVYDRDGRFIPIEERGMVRALAGQTTERELTVVRESGSKMQVWSVAAPLRAPDGSIDAVLISFQDITPIRELADAKERFLSIAAHELRSPITSLRATTSLLQIDPSAHSDPARRDLLLERVQRQVDRLASLSEKLLDLTRLNSTELPLEYADGNFATLCRDAVDLARMTDRDHRYTFEADHDLEGSFDAARLEQVLTNLLSNARRYSDSGTEITVRAQKDSAHVVIEVSDQGAGIAPEHRDRLFTAFYRGGATGREKGGLGLGLYIAHQIVRRHGGNLGLRSAVGKGSTFVVELPLRPPGDR